MTKEERKAHNAGNYPASVLERLNRITEEIYEDFNQRICKNCANNKNNDGYCTVLDSTDIYPDYYINDDSGFYVEGYEVNANFGCINWSPK